MNNIAAISACTKCEFGLAFLRRQVCLLKPHFFNVQLPFCQFSAKSSSKNNTLTMKKKKTSDHNLCLLQIIYQKKLCFIANQPLFGGFIRFQTP